MKILIVSFFNRWVTHLGTELELAEKHLQQGDSVTFLVCNGSVGSCMNNPVGVRAICEECILRRVDGIMQLSSDVDVHTLEDRLSQRNILSGMNITENTTTKDLKALRYKGHDLGWAAISSTASVNRDPLCESEEKLQMAKDFLAAAVHSYEGVCNFLNRHPDFDCAYVYNGRFAVTRGAFRALQDAEIPVFTHERGCSMNHYQLFPDTLPHDLQLFQESVLKSWDHPDGIEHRNEIANQFFQERKNGKPMNWRSFTDTQTRGRLPQNWNSDERKIVIFNSSEDEFAAIGDEFNNPVYESQAEALRRITRDTLATEKPIHYYLRVHPNLSEVNNTRLQELLEVRSPNLTIIHADDDVSTYCLLDACDCVLTFGSTVGVEATYWGKPSILAGKCPYEGLDIVYLTHNHAQVMDLLLDENLQPKNRQGALKYGYHLRTFGIRFEHWKPSELHAGSFGSLNMATPINTSDGSLTINNRTKLQGKILLLLGKFCNSKTSLQVADRITKYIFPSYNQLKKRIRIRR